MSDVGNTPSLPLTMLDEALLLLQEARSSWNVQFELGADHHLDEATFRQAVLSCYRRHPLTQARLAPARNGESSYQWNFADEVDRDPVRVVDCPDDAALDRLRAELYTPPIALDTGPGLRIALARRPGGDLVLLSVSHIVADGVGALRLMQTIARAYQWEPDPPDPLPLAQARDLGSFLAPKNRGERWARHMEWLRRFREALDPPSRIAVVGGTDRDDFGFVFRTLDLGETTTPGLHTAGFRHNDQRRPARRAAPHRAGLERQARRANRPNRGHMPVNVRPAHRSWDVVSNLTSNVTVSTDPDDRVDLATATAAMTEQTYQMRREDRAYGLHDLLEVIKKAPLPVKRAVPRLLPQTSDRFVDTAMLSNLGRIPEPPTLASRPDSGPPELWFSPPCDRACSVSIGVATSAQRLALVARYRYDQFDADAAEEFTDLLISQVGSRR